MRPRFPCSPGWTATCYSALAVLSVAPIRADEPSLTAAWRSRGNVDARIGASPTAKLDPQAGQIPEGEVKLGVLVEGSYEDNIFLSAKDAESDTVLRVRPSIAFRKGDAVQGEGAQVRFIYRPAAVFYLDHHDDNRIDHQASLEAAWRGRTITIAYAGEFQRSGDATADTGVRTDRNEWRNAIRLAWAPAGKMSWELAAGESATKYDEPRFFDAEEWFGEAAARFTYSPKTRISLAYRAGRFEVEDAGRQAFQRFTARLEWKPREKITVDLEAGAEHRTFDSGSDTTPVVEARVAWLPREGTEVYVTGYRREEASAFFPGQNYSRTGGALGLSQRLGDKWTGRIETGLERTSYERVSGTGASGREDRILFITPSLEYQLTEHLRSGIFFRYSKDRSNDEGFGYQAKVVGLQLRYEF